jgi:hypothetical protein
MAHLAQTNESDFHGDVISSAQRRAANDLRGDQVPG